MFAVAHLLTLTLDALFWCVHQVLQGLNLGLFRAGNKGGVGLPFRYHGSSLAVITAHLPADGSRRSKMAKRDKAVRELFSQARLSGEPFDLQLQYHHVVSPYPFQ